MARKYLNKNVESGIDEVGPFLLIGLGIGKGNTRIELYWCGKDISMDMLSFILIALWELLLGLLGWREK
jgi:hypothetical protein